MIEILTRSSQASGVPGNVIGKDDRPHTGLARTTFAHQQYLITNTIMITFSVLQSVEHGK